MHNDVDDILINAVIDSIPQWYISEYSPYKYSFKLGRSKKSFCTQVPLSERLSDYYQYVNKMLQKWKYIISGSPLPVHIEFIQGILALKWLSYFNPDADWRNLFMFLRNCTFRSFENNPVKINLIISRGHGTVNITNPDFYKLIDPIAQSDQVFIRIDKNLNFLSYEEIPWSLIKETEYYKFSPEFLQPFASILKDDEISIHLTERGDTIYMNHEGIITSKRKSCWHFYDVHNFAESIIKIFGDPRACMSLETLLDISYKRKGALIVYDPRRTVIKQVVNLNSIISEELGSPDIFRKMLVPYFQPRERFNPTVSIPIRRKRLFIELTSIDGAIICDDNKILSFGSMIKPHPDVTNHKGARSTAAESAYRWGGMSLNVSSDGEIRIYFDSYNEEGSSSKAQLKFM